MTDNNQTQDINEQISQNESIDDCQQDLNRFKTAIHSLDETIEGEQEQNLSLNDLLVIGGVFASVFSFGYLVCKTISSGGKD